MNVYSSTPMQDFLEDVRFRAAQTGAPPALIDKLDELSAIPEQEAEIEKINAELSTMEDNRGDLAEALRDLISAVDNLPADVHDDKLTKTIAAAEQALERSA